MSEEIKVYPCIPLRGVSIFPNTVVHFDIGREKSVKALEKAMTEDKLLFVATQKEEDILIPTFDDIYEIGTVIKVKQMLKIQGDAIRVLVEGVTRATIVDRCSDDEYMSCTIAELPDLVHDEEELLPEDQAAMRVLKDAFVEYMGNTKQLSDETIEKIVRLTDPTAMVDKMAADLNISCAKKQTVLGELDFSKRIRNTLNIISEEKNIADIENLINSKVKEKLDENQKEYVLREKLKVIQEELGSSEDGTEEAAKWLEELKALKLDKKIEDKVAKEIDRYGKMMPSSAESAVVRNYVETILALPWNKASKLNVNLKKAETILDDEHYGMEKVKERILEYQIGRAHV